MNEIKKSSKYNVFIDKWSGKCGKVSENRTPRDGLPYTLCDLCVWSLQFEMAK